MSRRRPRASITEDPAVNVHNFLRRWDQGSKTMRRDMLAKFVQRNHHSTGANLERTYGNGASLLLSRFSSWLRLTYLLGFSLALQLRAISIFVSASSGTNFMLEFLETGGVITILEILTLDRNVTDEDRVESVRLLQSIAKCGRAYKELICEYDGVEMINEAMHRSTSLPVQEGARNLIVELATGNPRYAPQLRGMIMSLLQCHNPIAQRMAAQAACATLSESSPNYVRIDTSAYDPQEAMQSNLGFVPSALEMLRRKDNEVHAEAFELLRLLAKQDDLGGAILSGLRPLLRNPPAHGSGGIAAAAHSGVGSVSGSGIGLLDSASTAGGGAGTVVDDEDDESTVIGGQSPRALRLARAAEECAIHLLRLLAEDAGTMFVAAMVECGIVDGLIESMLNTSNFNVSKNALMTCHLLCDMHPLAEQNVRAVVGDALATELLATNTKTSGRFIQRLVADRAAAGRIRRGLSRHLHDGSDAGGVEDDDANSPVSDRKGVLDMDGVAAPGSSLSQDLPGLLDQSVVDRSISSPSGNAAASTSPASAGRANSITGLNIDADTGMAAAAAASAASPFGGGGASFVSKRRSTSVMRGATVESIVKLASLGNLGSKGPGGLVPFGSFVDKNAEGGLKTIASFSGTPKTRSFPPPPRIPWMRQQAVLQNVAGMPNVGLREGVAALSGSKIDSIGGSGVGASGVVPVLYSPYRMPDKGSFDTTLTFTQRTFQEKQSEQDVADSSTLEYIKGLDISALEGSNARMRPLRTHNREGAPPHSRVSPCSPESQGDELGKRRLEEHFKPDANFLFELPDGLLPERPESDSPRTKRRHYSGGGPKSPAGSKSPRSRKQSNERRRSEIVRQKETLRKQKAEEERAKGESDEAAASSARYSKRSIINVAVMQAKRKTQPMGWRVTKSIDPKTWSSSRRRITEVGGSPQADPRGRRTSAAAMDWQGNRRESLAAARRQSLADRERGARPAAVLVESKKQPGDFSMTPHPPAAATGGFDFLASIDEGGN